MGSSRTSITMIETILFIWIVLPMIIILMAYLKTMGWSSPSKIVQVYSEDTNRIDEHGGPYEVMIKD